MVNNDKIYYNTYTGNSSDSMKDIYNYNIILKLQAFIVIILIVFFAKGYVKDKSVENLI